jgi:hypothetical protein
MSSRSDWYLDKSSGTPQVFVPAASNSQALEISI